MFKVPSRRAGIAENDAHLAPSAGFPVVQFAGITSEWILVTTIPVQRDVYGGYIVGHRSGLRSGYG